MYILELKELHQILILSKKLNKVNERLNAEKENRSFYHFGFLFLVFHVFLYGSTGTHQVPVSVGFIYPTN